MNRERLLPVVLALVCVVAFAFVAASVVDPTNGGRGGSSVTDPKDGPDRTSGDGGTSGREPLTDPGEFAFSLGVCIPFLLTGEFLVVVILGGLAIWAVLASRSDPFAASAGVVALAFPAFFVWLLLTSCGRQNQPNEADFFPSDPAPPSVGGNASLGIAKDPGMVVTRPSVVLLLLAVTAVVGVVGYVVWRDGDDEEPEEEPPEPEADDEPADPARVAALGTVAGEAADRLERDAGTENEVFRAWVAMTEHLPVDHPRSSTPAEFADAAVAAGVDREDVRELTELFEEVRYGGEPVTDDRERRAVEALRHIEDEYADEA